MKFCLWREMHACRAQGYGRIVGVQVGRVVEEGFPEEVMLS